VPIVIAVDVCEDAVGVLQTAIRRLQRDVHLLSNPMCGREFADQYVEQRWYLGGRGLLKLCNR
jgi:hypothetical protein